MKKYILTICLAIFLYGNFGQYELDIVRKYDNFIRRDVFVEVTDNTGILFGHKNCDNKNGAIIGGCTYFDYWNQPFYIEVSSEYPSLFENHVIHEVGHYILESKNEKQVEEYTKTLIDWVNNLK
jgi:Zn-dependent peptidase ImmA (M78 family)